MNYRRLVSPKLEVPSRRDGPTLRRLQLGFALGDDFGLQVRGYRTVLEELHRERALPLRHRSQVGRVAERFGERDFGNDLRGFADGLGGGHDAAAGRDVADDRALEG